MSNKTKAWMLILLGVVLISSFLWMQRSTGGQGHQSTHGQTQTVAATQAATADGPAAESLAPNNATAEHSGVAGDSSSTELASSGQLGESRENALRVFGTVILAKSGAPVAGSWVKAIVAGGVLESETDSQGQFEIDLDAHARKAGRLQIAAGVDGAYTDRGPEELIEFSPTTKEIGPLQLELVPAHLLQVHVRDGDTKQPIAGARVSLLLLGETTTDAQGMAQIFLPRVTHLKVEAQGYGRVFRQLWPQGQGPSQLTIDLARGIRVTGTIQDEEGNPVEDMQVMCGFELVMSDSEGRFDLGLVGEGNQYLMADKAGYLPFNSQFEIDLIQDQPEKVLDLTVKKLDENDVVRITGVCVDKEGAPQAGVEVSASIMAEATASALSNDLGHFEFEIQARNYTTLWAYKPGFAKHTQSLGLRGREKVEVRVVLGLEHRLAGRVVNREGEAVVGAMWTLEPRLHEVGQPKTRGYTDREGRFDIQGVDHKHSVVFSHIRYQSHVIGAPLNNDENAEIVLQPGAVYRGKVIEAKSGDPISSFNVVVVGEDEHRARQILSGNGVFEKTAEKDGQVASVRVAAKGYQTQTLELTAQALEADGKPRIFEMTRADLLVAGVVLDSQQRPWPGVQISLMGAEDPQKLSSGYFRLNFGMTAESVGIRLWDGVTSDAQGRFRFEGVSPEAALGLLVKGSGVATDLTLGLENYSEEQLSQLRITVKEGAMIRGTVSAKEYPDARGVLIVGESQQNPLNKNVVLNPDRQFSFDSLPPGKYWLTLTDGSYTRRYNVQKHAELAEQDVAVVNFGGEDGYKLSGMALMGGRALANGAIYLMREGAGNGDWRTTQTDGGGLFHFEDVAPGSYDVVAFRRDYGYAGNPHSHANRVAVTQADADQFREFAFRAFGSVRGRYINDEKVGLQLIGRTNDGLDYSRWLQVQQGPFEFPEVAPGMYSLIGQVWDQGQIRGRTLMTEMVVPEDGSDVDLGDVGSDEEARLVFQISGEDGALRHKFSLEVHSDQGDRSFLYQLTATSGRRELQVVPGTYAVRSRANGPSLAGVKPRDLTIAAGEEQVIHVHLRPVTHLKFSPSNRSRVLKSASIHYADGRVFSFTKGEHLETAELEMSLNDTLGQARNLPAGPCRLVVEAEDGPTWETEITLRIGITQTVQVFQPLQKAAGIP